MDVLYEVVCGNVDMHWNIWSLLVYTEWTCCMKLRVGTWTCTGILGVFWSTLNGCVVWSCVWERGHALEYLESSGLYWMDVLYEVTCGNVDMHWNIWSLLVYTEWTCCMKLRVGTWTCTGILGVFWSTLNGCVVWSCVWERGHALEYLESSGLYWMDVLYEVTCGNVDMHWNTWSLLVYTEWTCCMKLRVGTWTCTGIFGVFWSTLNGCVVWSCVWERGHALEYLESSGLYWMDVLYEVTCGNVDMHWNTWSLLVYTEWMCCMKLCVGTWTCTGILGVFWSILNGCVVWSCVWERGYALEYLESSGLHWMDVLYEVVCGNVDMHWNTWSLLVYTEWMCCMKLCVGTWTCTGILGVFWSTLNGCVVWSCVWERGHALEYLESSVLHWMDVLYEVVCGNVDMHWNTWSLLVYIEWMCCMKLRVGTWTCTGIFGVFWSTLNGCVVWSCVWERGHALEYLESSVLHWMDVLYEVVCGNVDMHWNIWSLLVYTEWMCCMKLCVGTWTCTGIFGVSCSTLNGCVVWSCVWERGHALEYLESSGLHWMDVLYEVMCGNVDMHWNIWSLLVYIEWMCCMKLCVGTWTCTGIFGVFWSTLNGCVVWSCVWERGHALEDLESSGLHWMDVLYEVMCGNVDMHWNTWSLLVYTEWTCCMKLCVGTWTCTGIFGVFWSILNGCVVWSCVWERGHALEYLESSGLHWMDVLYEVVCGNVDMHWNTWSLLVYTEWTCCMKLCVWTWTCTGIFGVFWSILNGCVVWSCVWERGHALEYLESSGLHWMDVLYEVMCGNVDMHWNTWSLLVYTEWTCCMKLCVGTWTCTGIFGVFWSTLNGCVVWSCVWERGHALEYLESSGLYWMDALYEVVCGNVDMHWNTWSLLVYTEWTCCMKLCVGTWTCTGIFGVFWSTLNGCVVCKLCVGTWTCIGIFGVFWSTLNGCVVWSCVWERGHALEYLESSGLHWMDVLYEVVCGNVDMHWNIWSLLFYTEWMCCMKLCVGTWTCTGIFGVFCSTLNGCVVWSCVWERGHALEYLESSGLHWMDVLYEVVCGNVDMHWNIWSLLFYTEWMCCMKLCVGTWTCTGILGVFWSTLNGCVVWSYVWERGHALEYLKSSGLHWMDVLYEVVCGNVDMHWNIWSLLFYTEWMCCMKLCVGTWTCTGIFGVFWSTLNGCVVWSCVWERGHALEYLESSGLHWMDVLYEVVCGNVDMHWNTWSLLVYIEWMCCMKLCVGTWTCTGIFGVFWSTLNGRVVWSCVWERGHALEYLESSGLYWMDVLYASCVWERGHALEYLESSGLHWMDVLYEVMCGNVDMHWNIWSLLVYTEWMCCMKLCVGRNRNKQDPWWWISCFFTCSIFLRFQFTTLAKDSRHTWIFHIFYKLIMAETVIYEANKLLVWVPVRYKLWFFCSPFKKPVNQ